VATRGTPEKLRKLQRALYLRAKKEPLSGARRGRSRAQIGSTANSAWSVSIWVGRAVQHLQGVQRERRGKPYAGNPHVRFDEGLLARALRTAGWGLLHHG
jgi:hypothetical protein